MTSEGQFEWLVAEDDESYFVLLERCSRRLTPAPKLVHVHDGLEAREYLDGHQPVPSLILSDLRMPRWDGFQLLDWTKHQPQMAPVPFLLITSEQTADDFDRAQQLGADEFLIKPETLDTLAQLVHTILERWCIGNRERAVLKAAIEENRRLARQLRIQSHHLRGISAEARLRPRGGAPRAGDARKRDSAPAGGVSSPPAAREDCLVIIVAQNAHSYRSLDHCAWAMDPNARVRWARHAEEALQMLVQADAPAARICVVAQSSGGGQRALALLDQVRRTRLSGRVKLGLVAKQAALVTSERVAASGVEACCADPLAPGDAEKITALLRKLAAEP